MRKKTYPMRLFIISILVILGTAFQLVLASVTTLDNDIRGIACGPVYSTGKGSQISLKIDQFIVEDGVNKEEIKIPFAAYKYTDIAFYDNLLDIEEYRFKYGSSEERLKMYHDLVDFEANKIITERNNISVEGLLDEGKIHTGYLEFKQDPNVQLPVLIDIERSAIYCVLITPPIDKGIKNLTISVDRQNSYYGDLSLHKYKEYYNLKLSFFIGIILAISFYFAMNNAQRKDLYIGKIPKWLFNYVLIPILLMHSLMLLILMIENNSHLNESTSTITYYGNILVDLMGNYMSIIFDYFTLLFAMGVGIIYLGKSSGSKYHSLPTLLHKRAKFLLYFHIFLTTICSIEFENYITNYEGDDILTSKGIFYVVASIFSILELLVESSWILLSIYYYFITKKSISKFPDFEEPGVSKRVSLAFRNSLLIITFFNYVLIITKFCFKIIKAFFENKPKAETLEKIIGFRRAMVVSTVLIDEKFRFTFFSWDKTSFSDYFIILSLCWIWIDHEKDTYSRKKSVNSKE